jgi:hypothetical protein
MVAVVALALGMISYADDRSELLAKRPVEEIEAELLAATPLGSEEAEVQKYVRNRWKGRVRTSLGYVSKNRALVVTYGHITGQWNSRQPLIFIISPPGTTVEALWVFSEDGRLVEIKVGDGTIRSDTDSGRRMAGVESLAGQAPVAPLVPVIGGGMRSRKLLSALAGLAGFDTVAVPDVPTRLARPLQDRDWARVRIAPRPGTAGILHDAMMPPPPECTCLGREVS